MSARAALTLSLDSQKALTRELNHRVRNNIQIIVSLLTMQSERISQGWVRDILDQARSRVSALGLIHRFLYEQDEERIGAISIAELLADLCAQIRTSHRRSTDLILECAAEACGCTVSFDRAVPLMLFALEAISDAVRRAAELSQPALIEVKLRANGHGCTMEVLDKLPAGGQPTFDGELLAALAEQIDARFAVEGSPEGTRTWLEFSAA